MSSTTAPTYRVVAQPWLRGPATVEAGRVILDEDAAEQSWLWTDSNSVPLELANIHKPDDIPGFVAAYGLLWSGPGAESLVEPVGDWFEASSLIRAALVLGKHVQVAVDHDHDDWLESMDFLRRTAGQMREAFEVAGSFYADDSLSADELLLRRTTKVVSNLVSKGLGDLKHSFGALQEYDDTDAGPGQFALVPEPPDLLTLAYFRVAVMLGANKPLATCENEPCKRIFSPHDARQRFCTERCASRARYRRWAEKRRAGEA